VTQRLSISNPLDGLDRWQQRRPVPSFLVALGVRYREDRGRQYGALLSYYGFVSLFPILLVVVTVLGIVLEGDPSRRDRILDTIYDTIPVVGEQLRQDPASLSTNGVVLAVGLLVSIWSGLSVVRIAQDALNVQWAVPRFEWPHFVIRQLRAGSALLVVGLGILLTTAATSLAAFLPDLPAFGRVLGAAAAALLNIAVLTASYRVLIQSPVRWRDLAPGGIVGGVALWAVQLIGGTYVTKVIAGASDVYGAFATMFGLLVWIALLARVVLLANEVNVVRAKRLWPRALLPANVTDADRRAVEENVRREVLFAGTRVQVTTRRAERDSAAHAVVPEIDETPGR
jgi:membrane protein